MEVEESVKSGEESINDSLEEKVDKNSNESNGKRKDNGFNKKSSKWWVYLLIALALVIIVLLLLLLRGCGSDKYKIKIHNRDDIIEVDSNFKLSDLEVDGGVASFLVDSDGNVLDPSDKLDSSKEYSTHLIPEGKETVKVTYINGSKIFSIKYQKGAGLLFPKVLKKKGFIFLGWQDQDTLDYPAHMSPVLKDMTLVAQYVKPDIKGGICKLNCDTNKDDICDKNCDTDNDGKPDTNIDTNDDGVCDLNCDTDHDNKCDYNCDTNNDGTCDENCDEKIGVVTQNQDVNYTCDMYHGLGVEGTEDTFVSATLDGKNIEPTKFIYGKYAYFDFTSYKGTGSKHTLKYTNILTDQTGQKYYLIFEINLKFAGNCDTKDDEVVNVEYTTKNTVKCNEYSSGFSTNTSNIVEKGLKINENSEIKLLEAKLDGDSDKVKVNCTLDKDKFGWGFKYTTYDDVKELVETRRGKTTTDVCIFEVITDGKKYVVTYNQTNTYDNCSNDTNNNNTNNNTNNNSSSTYTCPNGYTLSGTKCVGLEKAPCPSGYTDQGNGCSKDIVSDVLYGCDSPAAGSYAENGRCYDANGYEIPGLLPNPYCTNGATLNATGDKCIFNDYIRKTCPSGTSAEYTDNGLMCEKTIDATVKYSCSSYGSDYKLNGNNCIKTSTETINATKK